MAAQVPALFETLSGMPLSELLGKVRQFGDKAPKPPVVDATKRSR
jgi:flotillin